MNTVSSLKNIAGHLKTTEKFSRNTGKELNGINVTKDNSDRGKVPVYH